MKFSCHVPRFTSIIFQPLSLQRQGNSKFSTAKFYYRGMKISLNSIPEAWISYQVIRSPSSKRAEEDVKIPKILMISNWEISSFPTETRGMTALFRPLLILIIFPVQVSSQTGACIVRVEMGCRSTAWWAENCA